MATDPQGNEIGKLFVGGLHQNTTNDDLKEYFSKFGDVEEAVVMIDLNTQRSRGFGYVKFSDPVSVDKVISGGPHKLNDKEIDPKQCNINMKGKNRRSLKIFVGGIAPEVTEEDVREFFSQHGTVTDVNLMIDAVKQRHRGFAFVGFDDENVVKRLISLHHVNLSGKQVEIKAMEPPNSRRPGMPGLVPNPFFNNPNFGNFNIGGPRNAPHMRPPAGFNPGAQAVSHRYMTTQQQPDPNAFMASLLSGAGSLTNVPQTGGPNAADLNCLSAALSAAIPPSLAANLWSQQHSLWSGDQQGHPSAYGNPQGSHGPGNHNAGIPHGGPIYDYYAAAANFGMLSGGDYASAGANGNPHAQSVPPSASWSSYPASYTHAAVTSTSIGLHPSNPSGGHITTQGASHHQPYSAFSANLAGLGPGPAIAGAPGDWSGPPNLAAYNR